MYQQAHSIFYMVPNLRQIGVINSKIKSNAFLFSFKFRLDELLL